MNPETWKLIASIGGVLLTVVTGPIIWAMKAEAKNIRGEIKQLGTELRAEIKLLGAEVRAEIKETEKRLNERIDTRLVHR